MRRQANFFADVEHRSFVAFAFADHDSPVHLYGVHRFAHGFDGDVAIAKTHRARSGDRAVFDDTQKFQAKLLFHFSRLLERRKFQTGSMPTSPDLYWAATQPCLPWHECAES